MMSVGRIVLGTTIGVCLIILGFYLSYLWFGVLNSWCGGWPYIATVVAWLFLGGIPLILLFIFLGVIIGGAIAKS